MNPKKYPASTTALPLLTFAVAGYLVEYGVSKPVAGVTGLVVGLAPFAAAKITEWRKARR